ncbi:hypothetical protein SUGI_0767740 [Cryptomeria japonica]|nr:hypothetical protein SUGI_0767740 [Cryptomeria japonica]
MALARNASLNNIPYWTKFYVDFEGHGNIITVSYQAISPKGHLVGVTAIDIVLQSVLTNLPNALGDRPASRPTNPNASASIVEVTNSICPSCNGSRAICGISSNKTLAELICCDTCNLIVSSNPKIYHHDTKKWTIRNTIIVVVVLGSILVLAFVILRVWMRGKNKTTIQSPERPFVSGGVYEVTDLIHGGGY